MTKPAHHRVDVVRITEVLKHSNADKLEIIPIGGYQAVVAKGQFKVGDLGYYIPPDSIVPDRAEFAFLWGNATYEGGTPVKRRRIAARRLRGEWSEGLLMPTQNFGGTSQCVTGEPENGLAPIKAVEEGEDVSDFIGITHYNPPEEGEEGFQHTDKGESSQRPRSWRGWLWSIRRWFSGERREKTKIDVPTYDVDNIKKYMNTFQPGEQVVVTEKIHGSNARYSFRKGGLFGKDKMWAGSRNLWKAEASSCAWRRALADNPWIELWCRNHPGYTLYGEITPTQKGFDYGSGEKKVQFWLFDILTPEGKWAEWMGPEYTGSSIPGVPSEAYGIHFYTVPTLYKGPFDLEAIRQLVDGNTLTGGQHIREGVVIKAVPERWVRGVGRVQLKWVSNNYLEKDSK